MAENGMSDDFNQEWQLAVDWIYKVSKSNGLTVGGNVSGDAVRKMMQQNKCESGGFGEGLIYAIGRPLFELKTKTSKP